MFILFILYIVNFYILPIKAARPHLRVFNQINHVYSSDSEIEDEKEKQSKLRKIKNLKNMLEDVRDDCQDMIEDEKEKCGGREVFFFQMMRIDGERVIEVFCSRYLMDDQ